MRKRLLSLAAGLYPSNWRRRYGTEFAALLEDTGPGWRGVVDVFLGAIKMQILKGNFVRITAACGLAGLILAAVIAFRMPNIYVSRALMRITPHALAEEKNFPAQRDLDAVSQDFTQITQKALSRGSLSAIIQRPDLNLYQAERERQPLEDVIENMKHDVKIELLPLKPSATAFLVSFRNPDPVIAQKTTQALVTRLVDENFVAQKTSGNLALDLLDPASLPRKPTAPNRLTIALTGLVAGLGAGMLIALARRRRAA